jgi:serine/threonine protein kinase
MPAAQDGRPSIPGYTIRRPLATGGMGSVYEAVHDTLDRRVAIKVLQGQFADDAAFAERFLREARIAAKIEHPGVVTVHDAGRDADGHLFIAMGFIEGGDLAAWCREPSPLVEHDVLRIGRRCAEALAAIHQHGLIHRDIKPDNILMGPGGEPVVTDLGLARSQHGDDRMTATGQILGTPAYMSPEQATGAADIDHRTDVYSLGATLFALLAGRPPFKGETPWATVAAIINEPAPDLRDFRPEVQPITAALVARCLAKDPAERPADARALADELVACAAALDSGRRSTTPTMIAADPRPTPASSATHPATGGGWLPTILAGAALVLIAGLIAALAAANDDAEPGAIAEREPPVLATTLATEDASAADESSPAALAIRDRMAPKPRIAAPRDAVADSSRETPSTATPSEAPGDAAPSETPSDRAATDAGPGIKASFRSSWSSATGALVEEVLGTVDHLEPLLRAELLAQGLSIEHHELEAGNAKIKGQIAGSDYRLSLYPIDATRSKLVIESGFPRNSERQQRIRSHLDAVLSSP